MVSEHLFQAFPSSIAQGERVTENPLERRVRAGF